MKSKLLTFFGALIVIISITACTSSLVPISADTSFPSGDKYEILGRVSISSGVSNSGYTKLLEEAKKQYPEADDVVNIMVDAKEKVFLLIFKSYSYEMTGIAIDYK